MSTGRRWAFPDGPSSQLEKRFIYVKRSQPQIVAWELQNAVSVCSLIVLVLFPQSFFFVFMADTVTHLFSEPAFTCPSSNVNMCCVYFFYPSTPEHHKAVLQQIYETGEQCLGGCMYCKNKRSCFQSQCQLIHCNNHTDDRFAN